MTIEGIWTGEVYGTFGWEKWRVFLMQNSRIVGGDNRQYSIGTFNLPGDDLTSELHVHYYYDWPRTIFGKAREEFTSVIEAKTREVEINGRSGVPKDRSSTFKFA